MYPFTEKLSAVQLSAAIPSTSIFGSVKGSSGSKNSSLTVCLAESQVEALTLPLEHNYQQNKGFALSLPDLARALKKAAATDLELCGLERKEVAFLTGLDQGFLSRVVSNASPVTIPALALTKWTEHVGTASIFTVLSGGGFEIPSLSRRTPLRADELHHTIGKASLETGVLVNAHSEALGNDGRVDEDERAQLHAHALHLLSQVQSVVEATRPR